MNFKILLIMAYEYTNKSQGKLIKSRLWFDWSSSIHDDGNYRLTFKHELENWMYEDYTM